MRRRIENTITFVGAGLLIWLAISAVDIRLHCFDQNFWKLNLINILF